MCCRYSLEVPSQGTFNEYHNMFSWRARLLMSTHNICFLWRNKKNINTFESKKHLIKSYVVNQTLFISRVAVMKNKKKNI